MMVFAYAFLAALSAPVLATIVFVVAARFCPPRWLAWTLVVVGMGGSLLSLDAYSVAIQLITSSPDLPGFDWVNGWRAFGIVVSGLMAAKLVALSSWRLSVRLRGMNFVLYMMWPGINPEPFAERRRVAWRGDLKSAALWMLVGAGLWSALLVFEPSVWVRWALVLVATSLFVHFGVLRVFCGLLRSIGIAVQPLFERPLAATSLRSFWGDHWNRAFSDLMRAVVARPVMEAAADKRTGQKRAVFVSFLASGVLHEMALTWPVWSGVGGPLLYFVIQGTAVLLEARFVSNGVGRAVVFCVVVLPAPLLFPRAWTDLLEASVRLSMKVAFGV